MNAFARVLAAIAMVAVIAFGGVVFANRSPSADVGGTPSAAPSRSVAPSPSPTATPIDTSGWKSFTSTRHGETLRYPADWTAKAATAPWPVGTEAAELPNPMFDVFSVPSNAYLTFTVVSQPLPRGVTGTAWLTAFERKGASQWPPECWPAPAAMERTTVGGQPTWTHHGCGFIEAITFVGGRVYVLDSLADYDRPNFDAFLSTITFTPTAANDTPVGSPSSSPSPS